MALKLGKLRPFLLEALIRLRCEVTFGVTLDYAYFRALCNFPQSSRGFERHGLLCFRWSRAAQRCKPCQFCARTRVRLLYVMRVGNSEGLLSIESTDGAMV
jgi:hypothetical protein